MKQEITLLIDRYYQVQRHRIAISNQIFQLEEEGEKPEALQEFHDQFHAIEKDIYKYLNKQVKQETMWKKYLIDVKGIGPVLASALLANIDIERATHASSIWKYCGLSVDPETNRAEGRIKGKKLEYNPFMKTICWKIGESFVKTRGQYRQIYDTSKEYYQRKFPKEVKEGKRTFYTKGHIHAMSKRRATKLFLSDFWAKWREEEGLEVSEPFAHRGKAKKKK